MINIKKIMATGVLSIFAFSAVGCNMIQKTPEAIKKTVLATVGDEKITKGDLDKVADGYLKQQFGEKYDTDASLATQVKNMRTQMLELLVEDKILAKKATDLKVMPTDEEITKKTTEYVNNVKQQQGGDDALNTALKNAGMTLEEYTAKVKDGQKEQITSDKVKETVFKDLNVSDDDVKAYYETHKDSYKSADVSHILIKTDEAKAKEMAQKAKSGTDFATLAKENSEDAGTKEAGGEVGEVTYDSTKYVKEFLAGVKTLKEGEISEPVKSEFGYHIIKANKVTEKTFDQAKEEIKSTLLAQKQDEKYKAALEQWKKDYNVKTYEDKL